MEETREPMVSRTSTPSSKSRENKGLSACLLFGSALSDEFDRRRSNLDLLVEFEPQEPADRANSYFGLRDDLVGQTTVRAKSMRFELRTAAVQQKFDPVDLPRNMDEVLGSTQTCRAVI
jgi:predicted nucleotidyltransferase